jgi:hypothetical protein
MFKMKSLILKIMGYKMKKESSCSQRSTSRLIKSMNYKVRLKHWVNSSSTIKLWSRTWLILRPNYNRIWKQNNKNLKMKQKKRLSTLPNSMSTRINFRRLLVCKWSGLITQWGQTVQCLCKDILMWTKPNIRWNSSHFKR